MDLDQRALMDIELRNIRQVEVGEIQTMRQRGRQRTRRRLWVTLHAAELDALKRRGRDHQVSVAEQIRWSMRQDDSEAALQTLTGIGAEELLALPADPGLKLRRGSHGWRRRAVNWT